MPESCILLKAEGITKVFPGVTALNNVSLEIRGGEVHCLVGENGAGKSTLIKCMTGVYTPEQGSILIDNAESGLMPGGFDQVAYVPQEIDLFESMSVAENLFIPFERTGVAKWSDRRRINEQTALILKEFGINATPDSPVANMSVADQQLLQIARATLYKARILILDEPTASLTESDAERVTRVVLAAKDQGKAVVYISHKLDEVTRIGDQVTVLRNGEKVSSARVCDVDTSWMVKEMTGKEFARGQTFLPTSTAGDAVLSVRGVSGKEYRDISFDLHAGEILGFSGLIGSGRSELMLALYGYSRWYSGEMRVMGQEVMRPNPKRSLDMGMVYLSEDRKRMGILSRMSLAFNISILDLEKLAHFGRLIDRRAERSAVERLAAAYDVRAPSLDVEMRLLSGGNQQKGIIARTMAVQPKIVILDEPTKGIDVAAKFEIYRMMRALAEEQGVGVILVSSELDEIVSCSNRVIVMHGGRIQGEFEQPLQREAIVGAMFGQSPAGV